MHISHRIKSTVVNVSFNDNILITQKCLINQETLIELILSCRGDSVHKKDLSPHCVGKKIIKKSVTDAAGERKENNLPT